MNCNHAKKHTLPASSASHLVRLDFDVEAMLTACVPGGSIVDPLVVADNIRAWVADRKPAELAEQQGVELPPLPEAIEAEFAIPGASPVSVYTAAQMQDYAWTALAATSKQQVGEAQEQVSKDAVRQFIADRAPDDEHREDILSGDYDHTLWFDHIRELMEALAAPRSAPEGAAQFAGWQIWDAGSEAWESATEQLYWVVKRARPDEAREVFTPAPATLSTVKPPRHLRTRLREDV